MNAQRQPDFRRENLHRAGESFRHDPHDRERPAVDRDLRAEQRRIQPLLLPVAVTDNRDRRILAGRFFFRQKGAALRRLNTQNSEVIRGDDIGESPARGPLVADTDHREIVRHHAGEGAVLLADIEIGRIRKTAESLRIFLILRIDLHDLARLFVSRRLEEHRVHETEDGGVRANPEGEDDDRSRGETPRLHQLPESESEVVEHNSVIPRGRGLDSRILLNA